MGFDSATLEPVSEAHGTEDWSVRYNDCIWRLRWRRDRRWVYIYLMLEFQRTAPRFMAVRLLSYEGVFYEHLVKALQLGAGDLLPLAVPVLDRQKHAALRRDMKRWICEVLLPTRMPGVTVDDVEKLEEVGTMLDGHTLDWTAKWRMKGREEGREEGRREGEAVILLRQLERKFGPLKSGIRQRIESADADQLLVWGERFVTARSLAEVFGEEG